MQVPAPLVQPTAWLPSSAPLAGHLAAAVDWVDEQCFARGLHGVLVVPARGDERAHPELLAFARAHAVTTRRARRPPAGLTGPDRDAGHRPVLVHDPGPDDLAFALALAAGAPVCLLDVAPLPPDAPAGWRRGWALAVGARDLSRPLERARALLDPRVRDVVTAACALGPHGFAPAHERRRVQPLLREFADLCAPGGPAPAPAGTSAAGLLVGAALAAGLDAAAARRLARWLPAR
ncbi:hypothetical protein [Kineococcus sp. SYSU DK004]|uniref:hypothetical protein n=1 Tax=Kineococcus sp. SYSU DK004 TaxID=3383125 RepID=UPI003D7DAFDE